MTQTMFLAVLGMTVIACTICAIQIFNRLVLLKNRYLNAFGQIHIQLKRRHDLIPNLVEAAKGFLFHERETLEAVTLARNAAAAGLKAAGTKPTGSALMQLAGAENALNAAVGRFSMVIEAYPELKANEQVTALMEELTSTENKISFARQLYNDLVATFNTYKQSFPGVLVAASFGHGEDAELLDFDEQPEIHTAPEVELVAG